jgi:hypothetical protein
MRSRKSPLLPCYCWRREHSSIQVEAKAAVRELEWDSDKELRAAKDAYAVQQAAAPRTKEEQDAASELVSAKAENEESERHAAQLAEV